MEIGSSSMSRAHGKKTDKTSRRCWTQREEEMLISCMKELIATGWKGENGFKVGYIGVLELNMTKAFPGTDLRGLPHINSKLHVWKKNYNSLVTMLARSRVGFNDSTKMIDASNDAWAGVVKNDGNAHHMRFKSWPYFDDSREIFGKDRATGEHAEDVMEAVNDLINTNNMAQKMMDTDFNINFEGFFEETKTNSVCQPQKSDKATKSAGKKRKSEDGLEGLYDMVGALRRSTDDRLANIARRLGYEFDASTARKQVYNLLGSIKGITMLEKLDISKLLVKNMEYLELFTGLQEDARATFLKQLLRGEL